MLGYFKPITSLLSKEDKEIYQSLYCTLCHNIKNKYGYSSTMFIQHDLLFILLCSNSWERKFGKLDSKKTGCVMFPLKKVNVLENMYESNSLADISVFTVYTAYLNAVADGKGISLKNRGFKHYFNRAFSKSTDSLQIEQETIKELELMLINEHQSENTPDQTIEPVCRFYSELVVQHLNLDDKYRKLTFHTCKIMYYLDSLEDYIKDKAKGHYNILNNIYETPQQAVNYVQMKIFKSIAVLESYSQTSHYKGLVDNILYESLLKQFNIIKQKHIG
ncbi:DUF5685 family protein [Priestia megaterium]|uniref:DUF5685 family protein n=1 Tax=Priestia TaxID=2800373 RepID=UPI0035DB9BE6